jgi:hypothetical protein
VLAAGAGTAPQDVHDAPVCSLSSSCAAQRRSRCVASAEHPALRVPPHCRRWVCTPVRRRACAAAAHAAQPAAGRSAGPRVLHGAGLQRRAGRAAVAGPQGAAVHTQQRARWL